MSKFDAETIAAMQSVLREVCSHIPAQSTEARSFVAAKILECAKNGKQSHDLLLDAGRRAVIDQFGNLEAVRSLFR
jgi:urease gamma subunit